MQNSPVKRAAVLNLALLLTGVVNTMLGPLLPGFQARWNLSDANAGILFAAQFLTAVLVAAAIGPLAARRGYFALIPPGMILMAAGTIGCAAGSWPLAVAGVTMYGCGLGLAIAAANLGVAADGAGDRSRAILMLNLSWCAGAALAPQLIAWLGSAFLPSLAAALVVLSPVVVVMCGAGPRPERTGRVAISRAGWIAGTMLFLYVGVESSVAGWLSSLAMRADETRGLWSILPSVFWGGMLGGRVLAQAALGRAPARRLVPAGLLCASAAIALLIASRGGVATVAAGALAGFGFSPVFPLVVAQYGERSKAPSGLVFSAAGLGGGVVPPAVGWISSVTGSLRAGLSLALPLIAAVLWLQLKLARERLTSPRRTS